MKIISANNLKAERSGYQEIPEIRLVRQIITDVRKNGDPALRKYSKKFDGEERTSFELSKREIRKAYGQVSPQAIAAMKKATKNIRLFAKAQLREMKNFQVSRKGVVLGQRIVPIEKVGCYVPGGRYPLPSTALMCAIPAKVAGVNEVVVCSPKIKPATIVAADLAGADRIFSLGGAQAISAMAYGTESVPRVDKIVGPGNKFVTMAKKEVYGAVGIEFLAGPTEVLIIADEVADAGLIAADLLAQAEHDTEAKAFLVTTSRELANRVNMELEAQLKGLPTRKTARAALRNGVIILAKDLNEAVQVSDLKAPEHLELQVKSPQKLVGRLSNYGSLFIGKYSAEVFGDYCSGINHVLPTDGAARYTGGLSVRDFVKVLTWQKITKKGSKEMIRIASRLAQIEGLEAHKKAAELRKQNS